MLSQIGGSASTLLFRIGTDAHLYDDPDDVSIGPLLDSKFDSEKCEALKRLLALIAQGFDVSNFFPQVVKNVASQSLQVKKLVYLYLLHYAQKRPNESLLSINSFQKDLGDPNPLVRAWALRTMAGIRLHVIAPIVLVAVAKCARDPSVYVRKCAANALPKLHDLRLEEHYSSIEEIVVTLLSDHSPVVVGAAAAAFASVCPNNYSLIGKNYRRLCEILPDVEQWGQIFLIEILLRYAIARYGLVKESIMSMLHGKSEKDGSDDDVQAGDDIVRMSEYYYSEVACAISRSYIERPDEYLSRLSLSNKIPPEFSSEQFTTGKNNADVKILLQCTAPLLWSNNSAVVLAAAGVHWIMAPKEDVKRIVKPLLFLLRSSDTSKYVVLCNIQIFAKAMPSLFAQHFEDFFVVSSDSYQIKALKLEILSSISTESSISSIFKEFQDYVRDPDQKFAADTITIMGLCAERLPKAANTCLEVFLALIKPGLTTDFGSSDEEAGVLIQAIMSIKSIIKQNPATHEKVIIQLIRSLDSIKVPAARATVIWMIGEYCKLGDIVLRMLPTLYRYLAWSFPSESSETKLQILNSIVKVLLVGNGEDLLTLKQAGSYLVELAVCDLNFDVRDRARFCKKALSCILGSRQPSEDMIHLRQNGHPMHILAEHMFLGQIKQESLELDDFRTFLPGTLSQIVLHAAPGYEPLPKPCTMNNELGRVSDVIAGNGDLKEEMNGSEMSSGSLYEGSTSDYGSEYSESVSSGKSEMEGGGSASRGDDAGDLLIQISDSGNAFRSQDGVSQSASTELEQLISKTSLESWLDDQPSLPTTSISGQSRKSSVRIFMRNIESRVTAKQYGLLDPAGGNGLKVDYSFSSEMSSLSQHLIGVEVSFENCSSNTVSDVNLLDEESNKSSDSFGSSEAEKVVPVLVPMETVSSIEPGQVERRVVHVHFHHHLLPLKLSLRCNGKSFPVKLRPDIGYFVRPLPMDIEMFRDKETRLPGMFEYSRSCMFNHHLSELNQEKGDLLLKDKLLTVCESLALKMLSNVNLFLVSVDMPIDAKFEDASGLCLRFSSEILSNSVPCLITITAEGICSQPLSVLVKVNCEETVFGLNLLNRVVNILS